MNRKVFESFITGSSLISYEKRTFPRGAVIGIDFAIEDRI